MTFMPISIVPALPAIPQAIQVGDFVLNRPCPELDESNRKTALFCAETGRAYTREDLRDRVEHVCKGLVSLLGWKPNVGSPWSKVVAILSVNSLDYMPTCWAVHRAGGICLLLHPTTGVAELARHMRAAHCNTLVSCVPLMETCEKLRQELNLADSRIFMMNTAAISSPQKSSNGIHEFYSIEKVAEIGSITADPLEELEWTGAQGASQVAYLCATSGTSGKQTVTEINARIKKLARLTHVNLIVNVLQAVTMENTHKHGHPEVATAFLPFSHSYGLVLSHLMIFRGDSAIVFPEFDMPKFLKAITAYRIERLYLIPPITAALVANKFLLEMFDVTSVRSIVSGAGPFSTDLNEGIRKVMPKWQILAGYGLTESCVIASVTHPEDEFPGSSGILLPGFEARIVDESGNEVEDEGQSGELLLRSPSIIQGYLDDPEADRSSLTIDGWLRTGDVGLFKTSPKRLQHLFVIDRLKDMIKVKGLQVAPADIESCLQTHPAVAEVAVIGVADTKAGERPKAFIVRSPKVMAEMAEEELKTSIENHVSSQMTESHWLHDRIAVIKELPRGATKKVLKNELRKVQ